MFKIGFIRSTVKSEKKFLFNHFHGKTGKKEFHCKKTKLNDGMDN